MGFYSDFLKNLFPYFYYTQDSNKEIDPESTNKGTFERYLEVLGQEFDENLIPFIDNFTEILDPNLIKDGEFTMKEGQVLHLAYSLGSPPNLFDNFDDYRLFLTNVVNLYKFKGTEIGYEILGKILGLSLTLGINFPEVVKFDDGPDLKILDREFPRPSIYDSQCPNCYEYFLIYGLLNQPCIVNSNLFLPVTCTPDLPVDYSAVIVSFSRQNLSGRWRLVTSSGQPLVPTPLNNDLINTFSGYYRGANTLADLQAVLISSLADVNTEITNLGFNPLELEFVGDYFIFKIPQNYIGNAPGIDLEIVDEPFPATFGPNIWPERIASGGNFNAITNIFTGSNVLMANVLGPLLTAVGPRTTTTLFQFPTPQDIGALLARCNLPLVSESNSYYALSPEAVNPVLAVVVPVLAPNSTFSELMGFSDKFEVIGGTRYQIRLQIFTEPYQGSLDIIPVITLESGEILILEQISPDFSVNGAWQELNITFEPQETSFLSFRLQIQITDPTVTFYVDDLRLQQQTNPWQILGQTSDLLSNDCGVDCSTELIDYWFVDFEITSIDVVNRNPSFGPWAGLNLYYDSEVEQSAEISGAQFDAIGEDPEQIIDQLVASVASPTSLLSQVDKVSPTQARLYLNTESIANNRGGPTIGTAQNPVMPINSNLPLIFQGVRGLNFTTSNPVYVRGNENCYLEYDFCQARFAYEKTTSGGLNIQFSDGSGTRKGTITRWRWDFGDGSTSEEQNPFHTYSVEDDYLVTLQVFSSTGLSAIVTELVRYRELFIPAVTLSYLTTPFIYTPWFDLLYQQPFLRFQAKLRSLIIYVNPVNGELEFEDNPANLGYEGTFKLADREYEAFTDPEFIFDGPGVFYPEYELIRPGEIDNLASFRLTIQTLPNPSALSIFVGPVDDRACDVPIASLPAALRYNGQSVYDYLLGLVNYYNAEQDFIDAGITLRVVSQPENFPPIAQSFASEFFDGPSPLPLSVGSPTPGLTINRIISMLDQHRLFSSGAGFVAVFNGVIPILTRIHFATWQFTLPVNPVLEGQQLNATLQWSYRAIMPSTVEAQVVTPDGVVIPDQVVQRPDPNNTTFQFVQQQLYFNLTYQAGSTISIRLLATPQSLNSLGQNEIAIDNLELGIVEPGIINLPATIEGVMDRTVGGFDCDSLPGISILRYNDLQFELDPLLCNTPDQLLARSVYAIQIGLRDGSLDLLNPDLIAEVEPKIRRGLELVEPVNAQLVSLTPRVDICENFNIIICEEVEIETSEGIQYDTEELMDEASSTYDAGANLVTTTIIRPNGGCLLDCTTDDTEFEIPNVTHYLVNPQTITFC